MAEVEPDSALATCRADPDPAPRSTAVERGMFLVAAALVPVVVLRSHKPLFLVFIPAIALVYALVVAGHTAIENAAICVGPRTVWRRTWRGGRAGEVPRERVRAFAVRGRRVRALDGAGKVVLGIDVRASWTPQELEGCARELGVPVEVVQ